MEKKDLMIGDWVQYAQNYYTEKKGIWSEVYYGRVCSVGLLYIKVDRGSVAIEPEIIQPIPLTAEILEKNGFRNIGGHWYDDAADYYELEVEAYSDSIWRVIYHNTEFNIGDERVFVSHIHELQHALRLFGIKKEIEL